MPVPVRTPLWTQGFAEVAPLVWAAYVVLPIVLGLVFTPADDLRDLHALWFSITCNAIGTLCIGGVLHFLYAQVYARVFATSYRPATRVLLHLAAMAAAVLLGTELSLVFELPRHPGADPTTLRLLSYRTGIPLVTIGVWTLVALDRRRSSARQREEVARRLALQAQSQALQARTHPHFFFNSLNALAELMYQDVARAEQAMLQLATLYRYTLDASRMPLIPLGAELEALDDYLALESLRFGDAVEVSVETAPPAREISVPPLCLQPLVENAIRHGMHGRGRIRVWVTADLDENQLKLQVFDDGDGGGHSHGTQTSLVELRQRLLYLFGEQASLHHGPTATTGYRVCLTIPLRADDQMNVSDRTKASADA